jgi:hypothetical protein
LREIAEFDSDGLWSNKSTWFSSHGTLLATAGEFLRTSPGDYFADELAQCLHVEVHDALLRLVEQHQITRQIVSGANGTRLREKALESDR